MVLNYSVHITPTPNPTTKQNNSYRTKPSSLTTTNGHSIEKKFDTKMFQFSNNIIINALTYIEFNLKIILK